MYFFLFFILLTICNNNAANVKKVSDYEKKFSFLFGS